MESKVSTTPLMTQYYQMKGKYPDALLLFRVGDFYETFGADAIKTSKILGITLTKRGNGSEKDMELAGFPHHAIDNYLPKLIKSGLRVAICDQLEDPKQATGKIVKRGVTELVTPGITLHDQVLTSNSNNFLAAIHKNKDHFGVSFLDISTGEFMTSDTDASQMIKLLQAFKPSEVLFNKNFKKELTYLLGEQFNLYPIDEWVFVYDHAKENLLKHFGTKSLKCFGIEDLKEGIVASGVILHYLSATEHSKIKHLTNIQKIREDKFVWLDSFTVRNLELFESNHAEAKSLMDILDHTSGPMGGRMLKKYVAMPLKSVNPINQRLDTVGFLIENEDILHLLREHIKEIGDLERLISKVATGRINPREFLQIKKALCAIDPIQNACNKTPVKALKNISVQFTDCFNLIKKIDKTIDENSSPSIGKGATIRKGFSEELDKLRSYLGSNQDFLEKVRIKEINNTGIQSLKIGSNNVFGFYLEVRNTYKDKVPEYWIRKQTLTNAERYITEELKEYEQKIYGAEERILSMEQRFFNELIEWATQYVGSVQSNAKLIAHLDCMCGFAFLAKTHNYHRPIVDEGLQIEIKAGRHPVIEAMMPKDKQYVPNDLTLNNGTQQILMITGPNMSGKSAVLRQTALIVLLAQIGSFIPAEYGKIGLVDKIFTRVGASDNISLGESTFMVEMNETANILNNLSERSLILLDEIGRGTSTYDGISIAWAIAEFLHQSHLKPKTLFATHYHELNDMCNTFERIQNFSVAIKETEEDILFLHKLVKGGSKHSFGIHVAKMAGMPKVLVQRANEILKQLEHTKSYKTTEEIKPSSLKETPQEQLRLFTVKHPELERLQKDLAHLNLDHLTPMEALFKLKEIQNHLNQI